MVWQKPHSIATNSVVDGADHWAYMVKYGIILEVQLDDSKTLQCL